MSSSHVPAVSVLLPFYQAGATFARCLESLLTQTLTDLEIVAVDDGSQDEGPSIAAAFARHDPRVRVLTLPHRGIVPALNAGLAGCRGRYIARMDADDVALSERLARQKAFLEANPECELAGSLVEPFSDQGCPGEGVRRYHDWMNSLVSPEEIRAALFVESPMPHPAFFARREVFQRLNGYQDPPWPEDYDFLLRAAASGSVFGKVPKVLLRRLDHPKRLTRIDGRYKRDAMFLAKAHYFARGPWLSGKSGVIIGGSGTSGRKMATLLGREGVSVLGFLDNRVGPPNRKVLGLPAFGYPDQIPASFFQAHRDAFFLSCIGQPDGRDRLVRHLHRYGFVEEHDYLRVM